MNNPTVRKLVLAAAGVLMAYAGFVLLNTVNASATAANILTSAGQIFSAGLIIYGLLITAGYLYSLLPGKTRPAISRVPFVPSTNDPGITKEDRIKALDDLRQQKIITDAQYEEKKAAILAQKW